MSKLFRMWALLCALGMIAALAGLPAVSIRAQNPLRVTHIVNGTLGDRSFFDSAQAGLELAVKDLGIQLKTIELGNDMTRWEAGIDDAMADVDNYDVIILGGSLVVDYVTARADQYPDKKIIFHDEPIDFSKCPCANVYNAIYAQNEGSYLAGVYAAAMLKEGNLTGLANRSTIGAVGGIDIPVINDFIVGYEQGAKSVTPEMTVLRQYIGGDNPWDNPAKGKEIALAMYDQGADIVFNIAGGSGKGLIEAGRDRGRYVIGVDSDQWLFTKDTDPAAANQILTSMIKNVGATLYRALKLEIAGELSYGITEVVGIPEGAIGLAKNEYFQSVTPESVLKTLEQAEADVTNCKVKVATTLQARECVPPAEATANP